MNEYIVTHTGTSGLNKIGLDINAFNFFGMRPIHVAAQAGLIDEFETILKNPDCEPNALSKAGFSTQDYVDVFRANNGRAEVANEMLALLNDHPQPVSALRPTTVPSGAVLKHTS